MLKYLVLEANPDLTQTPDRPPVIRLTKHQAVGLSTAVEEVLEKYTSRPGSTEGKLETTGLRHHQSIWEDSPSGTSGSKISRVTGSTPISVPQYNGGCLLLLPSQVACPFAFGWDAHSAFQQRWIGQIGVEAKPNHGTSFEWYVFLPHPQPVGHKRSLETHNGIIRAGRPCGGNFSNDSRDCFWIHFVDDATALSYLLRSGSSVEREIASPDKRESILW